MKKEDISKIYSILKKQNIHAPVAELISIQTNSPEKVLLATILSSRTKDETTSKAAGRLFTKVHRIQDLERLSVKDIEKLIYPVGFYKTKARHLKQLPKAIKEKFSNKLPETIAGLIQLPGVGRKTANLVLSAGFNKPAIAVDGYIKTRNPYETEMILRKKLPKQYWGKINALFVAFGQTICRPVSPYCSRCPIKRYCKRIGVKSSR